MRNARLVICPTALSGKDRTIPMTTAAHKHSDSGAFGHTVRVDGPRREAVDRERADLFREAGEQEGDRQSHHPKANDRFQSHAGAMEDRKVEAAYGCLPSDCAWNS